MPRPTTDHQAAAAKAAVESRAANRGCLLMSLPILLLLGFVVVGIIYSLVTGPALDEPAKAACAAVDGENTLRDRMTAVAAAQQTELEDLRRLAERSSLGGENVLDERYESVQAWCEANG